MSLNFQRTTLSTQFIPEIDGLRFFAISTVVLFHLNTAFSREVGLGADLGMAALGGKHVFTQLGWWIVRLDLGVKVFFAISGFVLALPFLKKYLNNDEANINLKQYFARRLTRLEPPFVISLVVFTIVHFVVFNKEWHELSGHFWAGIFYLHGFVYGEYNPINPVTWSLETEAQFYILVPVIFALAFAIRNKYFSWVFFVVLFVASIYLKSFFLKNHFDHFTSSILSFFHNFTIGILVAFIYLKFSKSWLLLKNVWWDAIGLFSIFLLFYFYKPQADILNCFVFNVAILLLMLSSFKGVIFNKFFTLKIIYTIGGMCYSIYLLHFAFFHLLVKFTKKISLNHGYVYELCLQTFICLPILLVVAGLFFLLIEKPCMDKKWPEKLLKAFSGN